MNRWPLRHWKVHVAWIALVASLLAAIRHLGLSDGDLGKASIQTLRSDSSKSLTESPTGNARPGCTYARTGPGSHPDRGLAGDQGAARSDLTLTPTVQRPGAQRPGAWNPAPPTRPSDPDLTHRPETMIKMPSPATKGPPLLHP